MIFEKLLPISLITTLGHPACRTPSWRMSCCFHGDINILQSGTHAPKSRKPGQFESAVQNCLASLNHSRSNLNFIRRPVTRRAFYILRRICHLDNLRLKRGPREGKGRLLGFRTIFGGLYSFATRRHNSWMSENSLRWSPCSRTCVKNASWRSERASEPLSRSGFYPLQAR
jgi:hypothetical protein